MRLDRRILIDAIKKIYLEKGSKGLSDGRLFTALLKDSLGADSRESRILVRIAANTQIRELLFTGLCKPLEVQQMQQCILSEFENELGMSRENSVFFLEVFSEAFAWPSVEEIVLQRGSVKDKRQMSYDEMPKIGNKWKVNEIEFMILAVSKDAVLLLSKDITDIGIPYHTMFMDISWQACSLRTWLNTIFLSRFSKEEQARIQAVPLKNEKNKWYGTGSFYETKDKIFLLSIDEVVAYFGDSGQLLERPRNQWMDEMIQKGRSCAVDDVYNEKRQAKYKNSNTWWWLRSTGARECNAAYVNTEGVIFLNGDSVFDTGGTSCQALKPGIRPAFWYLYKGEGLNDRNTI